MNSNQYFPLCFGPFAWLGFFACAVLCSLPGCQIAKPKPVQALQWELYNPLTDNWISADVPGDALTDLLAGGSIPDPYHGTNETTLQWVEEQSWVYRTRALTTGYPQESKLRFEGLDTYASVVVNDSLLLETDNAHRAYEINLPAHPTAWDIEVTLHSAVKRGQALLDQQPRLVPVSNEMKPLGKQTSSVTRKPFYHFGWDWGPRLVSGGISGTVAILPRNQPNANDVRIESTLTSGGAAAVTFAPTVSWPDGTWTLIAPGGHTSSPTPLPEGGRFDIEMPELWWPNGMGDQPLYLLRWSPSSSEYRVLEWKIGLRTIEWVRTPDRWGQSFQCTVNGQPVQARGANTIPADFFTARSSARERSVLQSAVDANMNMVRVWGGASYPSEQFYDFCDSAGLLVWQDFMFACAMVPGDRAFLENVTEEAVHQVKRLRHRPSLALWCGNNESKHAWENWGWPDAFNLHGEDSVATERAYASVFHEALPAVVSRESNTAYWPSSPSKDPLALLPTQSQNDANLTSGDEHAWRVWFDTLNFDYFSSHAGRFASEYGLQSLPDSSTLASAGIRHFEDETLQFRQRSNMDWLEPGLDGWGMMRIYAKRYTADPAASDESRTALQRWIYLSQLTQALGLREALERHRTSEGRYAGSLYWQLSDVWPTVSWSTVDYEGRWKLAHYAVQQANKPRCIQKNHGRNDKSLVAFNDAPGALESTALEVALLTMEGDTLHAIHLAIDLPAFSHRALELGEAFNTARGILRWTWSDVTGTQLDASTHLHAKPAEVDWPDATIETVWKGDSLVLTSDQVALGVRLQLEGVHFEENGFMLFPNEPKTVGFRTTGSQNVARDALNVEHFAQYQ